MTISYSIPTVLSKVSPVLKIVGILAFIGTLIAYVSTNLLMGLINAVLGLANCWILAILCDAVVELYGHAEKAENTPAEEA